MSVAFLALSLILCVFGQADVPARNFTDFKLLGRTLMPTILDTGFRIQNVSYWGSNDDDVYGPSSLSSVDLTTHKLASFQFSTVAIGSNERFVKGWPIPTGNNPIDSLLLINTRSEAFVGVFLHGTSYRSETITYANCSDDDPDKPVTCNGNITQTTTSLVSSVTKVGNLVKVAFQQCLGGEVFWPQNRGYFVTTGSNFSVNVIDITTGSGYPTLRTIPVTGAGGFALQTQISEDGGTLYLLTSNNRFYRVNFVNTSRPQVELVVSFPAGQDPLDFVVSDRYNESVFTIDGFPSSLAWVDLELKRIYETTPLPSLFSPQVILKDAQAGFAFAIGFNRPSLIVRVNLETHDTDAPFNPNDSGRSVNGFIDPATASLFIGASNQAVHIRYPGACPGFCSGNGVCDFGGVCKCNEGWTGLACNFKACVQSTVDNQICSGNGICSQNGTCDCFPGYLGDNCETYTCPSGCSNQGTCDVKNHICTCNPGWTGIDCSESLFAECGKASTCSQCAIKTVCVWCETNASCILGDINGPLLEYCPAWQHRNCNFLAFRIIGYIFVAVCFLFIFLNLVFTLYEDKMGEPALLEKKNIIRSLWVAQRDQQTWMLIEQCQMGALTAYVATSLPSNYKSFTDALSIVLVSAAPAWQTPHLPDLPNRRVQSILQTGITKGAHPLDLMAGGFFIFLLLICFNILWGLVAFASQNNIAKWRTTNLFFRICQFCQPGLVALGAWTMTQIKEEYSGALSPGFSFAGAFLSVFGLGFVFPIFGLIFIQVNKKNLFAPSYRVQFGSFYDVYHHDKFWFGPVNLLKVTFISLFVGFFADESSGWHSPVMSMLMPIFIIIIFVICTLVARPFIDKLRGLIQTIMLAVFNIFIFGLCIIYLKFEPFDGWGVAIAAFIGGGIFNCLLMWIMNHLRIRQPHATSAEDNAYIRM